MAHSLLKLFQFLEPSLLMTLNLLEYVALTHVPRDMLVSVFKGLVRAHDVLLAIYDAYVATIVEGSLVQCHLGLAQLLTRGSEVVL